MISSRLVNIGRGFSNPVLDSQSVFRAALQALCNPGVLTEVPCHADFDEKISAMAYRPAAALLLALLDADTKLWVSETLSESLASHWLTFHTGCQIVSDPGQAQFAWISHLDPLPDPRLFAQGSAEYPDQSTSCVYELPCKVAQPIESARPNHGVQVDEGIQPNNLMQAWQLTGPGLKDPLRLVIEGLPKRVAGQILSFRNPLDDSGAPSEQSGEVHSRRLDLFLATTSHLIGLPRSTHLVLES